MRASVVLIEISFLCNFILYAQFSYGLKFLEMSCPVFSMCQSAMTSFREENICESPRGLPEPSGSLKQANRQSQVSVTLTLIVLILLLLLLLLLPLSRLFKNDLSGIVK